MTRLKVRISSIIASFAQISSKQALKYTIFFNIQKRPKMAESFCFWQTFSKKAEWQPRKMASVLEKYIFGNF